MGVIAWVARQLGWIVLDDFETVKRAHHANVVDLENKLQLLRVEVEVLRAHNSTLMGENDQLERRVEYLVEGVRESSQELREIRKGLMVRMGILQKTEGSVDPPAPHAPINKRRAPWDRQRAELEADSKEKMEHWTKKIEEVEKKDKVREAMAEPPVANGIAEPENE